MTNCVCSLVVGWWSWWYWLMSACKYGDEDADRWWNGLYHIVLYLCIIYVYMMFAYNIIWLLCMLVYYIGKCVILNGYGTNMYTQNMGGLLWFIDCITWKIWIRVYQHIYTLVYVWNINKVCHLGTYLPLYSLSVLLVHRRCYSFLHPF